MEKKNSVLGVLVILLSVVVLELTGFIVYDKVLNKDTKNENNNNGVEVNDNSSVSAAEMLDKVVGKWGNVNGMTCFFLSISNEDNKYIFNSGQYGTDGGLLGDIIEYKAVDSEKLYLKVHFPERINEVSETPEQTNEYVINISELSSNIIILNNKNWEKVTGTWEDFFNSKIPNRF